MQSGQKGSVESSHIQLRYILPKETNLTEPGLTGHDAMNTALSHVNSVPLKSHKNRSALDLAEFMYPDLYAKFCEFDVHKIDPNCIILKPYLLKISK